MRTWITTVMVAGCSAGPADLADTDVSTEDSDVAGLDDTAGANGTGGQPLDPALQACLGAPRPDAAALLAEIGEAAVLAAVAPGALNAVPDGGGDPVAVVLTAAGAADLNTQVQLKWYPDGDPRIVAENHGCVTVLSFATSVTLAAADGTWSFQAPGWVRAMPAALLPPGRPQAELTAATRLTPGTRSAMGLADDLTGEVQIHASGSAGDPASHTGDLAFERDVSGGADTGLTLMDVRWRW